MLEFELLYGGAALLSPYLPYHLPLYFAWELAIPFWPQAALIYLSLNLVLLLCLFALPPPEVAALCRSLRWELRIAVVFFLLIPIQSGFPEHARQGALGWAEVGNWAAWRGCYFPSLHVAFAWTAATFLETRWGKASYLWAAAVSVSTLVTHQHHVIDVAGGMLLAWAVVSPRGWCYTAGLPARTGPPSGKSEP